MMPCRSVLAAVLTTSLSLAACGGSSDGDASDEPTGPTEAPQADSAAATGIRVVTPQEAAVTIDEAADDLVILDIRTPEEFAEGHIDGAVMLDFYRADFRDELAQLDTEVPYVLYCRSGNRSGQARAMMVELGFTSVDDVGGGIVAWEQAGLPVTTD